jgi:hypothetical protein
LYPYLLVEFIRLLCLAGHRGTGTTRRVILADGYVDDVHGAEGVPWYRVVIGLGAFVYFACSVFVIVHCDFEKGDWATVVEVGYVGFGVEVLARDVAVVGCFEPVPRKIRSAHTCTLADDTF